MAVFGFEVRQFGKNLAGVHKGIVSFGERRGQQGVRSQESGDRRQKGVMGRLGNAGCFQT